MTAPNDYGSMTSRDSGRTRSLSLTRTITENGAVAIPRTDNTFYVGISLLMLVVLLWTSSNFLTNFQLTQGYDKPFAVTYLNTSSFVLYLLPFFFVWKRKRGNDVTQLQGVWATMGFVLPQGSFWQSSSTNSDAYTAVSTIEEQSYGRTSRTRERLQEDHHRLLRPSSIDGRRPELTTNDRRASIIPAGQEEPLDLHQTAVLAAHFMIVWFLANYCLNVALKLTSVASATTLSSASGFFTLALGAAIGVELFTLAKLGAVTMSFLGVLMVTSADSSSSHGSNSEAGTDTNLIGGDLLALASALFYAVYVVLLKARIGREDRVSMPLFFGFVGAFNILVMWPVGVLLHLTGVETIELPEGRLMWAGVLVNMSITVVSDFSYLLAMLKSSPLVATVGLSLTIPLAILGDFLLGSHSGGLQAYIGSAVVLTSFFIIGLADRKVAKQQITPTTPP